MLVKDENFEVLFPSSQDIAINYRYDFFGNLVSLEKTVVFNNLTFYHSFILTQFKYIKYCGQDSNSTLSMLSAEVTFDLCDSIQ